MTLETFVRTPHRFALTNLVNQVAPCSELIDQIQNEIAENPPLLINKGGVFADGVNDELDDLRKLAFSGKDYLVSLQQREIERTGITSLKIAFNNVFGYYIEVKNTHKDKVPPEWIRKQTLVNAERYITERTQRIRTKNPNG